MVVMSLYGPREVAGLPIPVHSRVVAAMESALEAVMIDKEILDALHIFLGARSNGYC